jgi:hypothetical protein
MRSSGVNILFDIVSFNVCVGEICVFEDFKSVVVVFNGQVTAS